MSIAIASLIALAIIGALGGLLLSRVFGAAAARNEDRPRGGEDGEGGGRTRPGGGSLDEAGKRQAGLFFGGIAAALGALMGVAGVVLVLLGDSLMGAVPVAFVGILMGAAGYSLGARRLGRVAIVLAVVALLFAVAASQGMVPGVERTDHPLPEVEPRSGG